MQKKQRAQEATHAAAQAGRKAGPGALGANGGVTPRVPRPAPSELRSRAALADLRGPPSARSSLTDVGAAQLAARRRPQPAAAASAR